MSKVLAERNNIIIDLQDLTFVRRVGEGAFSGIYSLYFSFILFYFIYHLLMFFSEVWEGYWNGVHVAIKKLKSMVNDELFQERFLREIESLRYEHRSTFIVANNNLLYYFIEKVITKMW